MQNLQDFLSKETDNKIPISLSSQDHGQIEKSINCEQCNDAKFVRLNLPIDHVDFGKAIPCDCVFNESDEDQLNRFQKYSRIGSFESINFDYIKNADFPIAKNLSEYFIDAQNFRSNRLKFLLIQSASGLGKTLISAAILNDFIVNKTPSLFYNSNDLFEQLYSAMNNDPKSYDDFLIKLRAIPLLVIDDLVLHHVSSWALEKFIQLLIYRFDQGLKTVINYIELPEEIDQRIVSRFEDKNQSQKITIIQERSSFIAVGAMNIEQIQNYTFMNFNPQGHGLRGEESKNLQDALGLAKNWSDDPEGWLVLIGSPGCGKTHLAAAICNNLIKLNYDVCFASVPDLLDEFRASFSSKGSSNFEQLFKKITQSDLLVLDDLGANQNSPWVNEKLYQIFNYRYIKKMPTIVTKNLESSDLDLRIKSRLSDLKLATNFEILAPDYRIGSF